MTMTASAENECTRYQAGSVVGTNPTTLETTREIRMPLSMTVTVVTNRAVSTTRFRPEARRSLREKVRLTRTTQSQLTTRWTSAGSATAAHSHSCNERPVAEGS